MRSLWRMEGFCKLKWTKAVRRHRNTLLDTVYHCAARFVTGLGALKQRLYDCVLRWNGPARPLGDHRYRLFMRLLLVCSPLSSHCILSFPQIQHPASSPRTYSRFIPKKTRTDFEKSPENFQSQHFHLKIYVGEFYLIC